MRELRSSSLHSEASWSSSFTDTDTRTSSSSTPPAPPPPPSRSHTLLQPAHKKRHKAKVFRAFRSVFRSFPVITPSCKFPSLPNAHLECHHHRSSHATKVTGTLFGYRKGRVSLAVQETSRCLPSLVIELAIQTSALQKEMSAGMVRIALECEKRQERDKTKLMDEPLWTMFCNGKKTGYGVKREAAEEDLHVMELLRAVSMGAGVLPGNSDVDGSDAEMAYFRAQFEHVAGSKDSETLYMLSPEGNSGPDLTIFFVRL
ncbi:protein MIZU-KUSSEI 1 [Neltuma alba]|uniref:protein MIZU-KUSSEI 1 n=1 Tax=Neltuma alba TaxID=207710 RepID=UPI0010A38E49|nr:protein MIZU-KUSSEI 1 [Prosopis alba]